MDVCVCLGGGEGLGLVKLRQETSKYDLKTSFPSEFCVSHGSGASHRRTSVQVSGKELLSKLGIHWTVCNTLPKYENITLCCFLKRENHRTLFRGVLAQGHDEFLRTRGSAFWS